ncbi:MAG: antibiotic biosynthesis monooxygenase [Saprospiraceae bacterium]|nr:antibiotic biosynthesis monooxygenase [Saprospiraceae bacterium]
MIKRIVRMHFRPDGVEPFLKDVFEDSKDKIRAFPGCRHRELMQQTNNPNVLYTFSIWDDEAALERYRNSDLFKTTWIRTKVLFEEKAHAWTVKMIDG